MSEISRTLLVLAGCALGIGLLAAASPVARYEEVRDWPSLPAGVRFGEVAGVAVETNGHVLVFHRPGRGFDVKATSKLTAPAVLDVLCFRRLREQSRGPVRSRRAMAPRVGEEGIGPRGVPQSARPDLRARRRGHPGRRS